jgi:hypothetical protein
LHGCVYGQCEQEEPNQMPTRDKICHFMTRSKELGAKQNKKKTYSWLCMYKRHKEWETKIWSQNLYGNRHVI